MSVNDQILTAIRQAGSQGLTAYEVESALRPILGNRTHQTVTGNTRHLVEDGELLIVGSRYLDGSERHIYIVPEFYSHDLHGQPVHIPHTPRAESGIEKVEEYRRKVRVAGPSTILNQVRRLIRSHPNGLTCREIEQQLGISHQTASARLAELHGAQFIEESGSRALAGEPRPQPVYRSLPQPTLFDGISPS